MVARGNGSSAGFQGRFSQIEMASRHAFPSATCCESAQLSGFAALEHAGSSCLLPKGPLQVSSFLKTVQMRCSTPALRLTLRFGRRWGLRSFPEHSQNQ